MGQGVGLTGPGPRNDEQRDVRRMFRRRPLLGVQARERVKRFHARMFGAAISTGAPVQPVMLRYSRAGALYEDITFRPNEHFLANFLRLLMQPSGVAEVRFLPPLDSTGKRRRDLAEEAEAAVRDAFAAELPHG